MYVRMCVRTLLQPMMPAAAVVPTAWNSFFFSAVGYIKGKQYDSSSETKARPALTRTGASGVCVVQVASV